MTTERDPQTRVVLSWLREDQHESVDRVLASVLDEVDMTPQRRSWWPAWRIADMNPYAKVAIAAAAVLVIAFAGYQLLPGNRQPGSSPSPSPAQTAEPTPAFVSYSDVPFGPGGFGRCPAEKVDPTCVEDPKDDTITFTYEAPASWKAFEGVGVWIDLNAPPDGAAMFFARGTWLHSDPCLPPSGADPDIPVGPTVDDYVTALVNNAALDVTAPTDITFAGYSGKYLDLTVPDDISACSEYLPMDAHIYAQGPGHRWHFRIVDVGGVRVVVETYDYVGTSPQRLAELQAILDSLAIKP